VKPVNADSVNGNSSFKAAPSYEVSDISTTVVDDHLPLALPK